LKLAPALVPLPWSRCEACQGHGIAPKFEKPGFSLSFCETCSGSGHAAVPRMSSQPRWHAGWWCYCETSTQRCSGLTPSLLPCAYCARGAVYAAGNRFNADRAHHPDAELKVTSLPEAFAAMGRGGASLKVGVAWCKEHITDPRAFVVGQRVVRRVFKKDAKTGGTVVSLGPTGFVRVRWDGTKTLHTVSPEWLRREQAHADETKKLAASIAKWTPAVVVPPTHTLSVKLFFADGDVFIDVDNTSGRVLVRDPENALKARGALHAMRSIVQQMTVDLNAALARTGLDQSTR